MQKSNSIRSLVFIALFAALFIVLSLQQLKITVTPVPITLQTLAVILAGLFLKPKHAFASIFAVIALTATGLPLIGGKGGLSLLTGYTGGFIFAFPFCAMFISMAVGRIFANENLMRNKALSAIVLFIVFELLSSLLAYIPGIPWMMYVLEMPTDKALAAGFYPFIPGDAAKSAIGVAIALGLAPQILRIRGKARSTYETNQEAMIIR
ncbi:biotin transporter BioY [Paenibacillus sp. LHD-117]|uniref:biotin transporter BioY n=1 Tax=Paenibacillus sp. LHD-117 TaxID=3071412 RepID=UPI0027DFD5E8|nr:biotin transporter BioY [Paenibacillus sp. LHD-117]MDQ6419170.1 biotin transporter BioY [Paenibacillus sp. LHD-117]